MHANLPLAYLLPAILILAVICWMVGLYNIIRFAIVFLRRLRAGTAATPAAPSSIPFRSLLAWCQVLLTDCAVYARRFLISLATFAGLVVLGVVVASTTGPLRF